MESTANADEFATESTRPASRAPRLFIKEMVMRNFKSYAGEQRVGPFHKVRVFVLLEILLISELTMLEGGKYSQHTVIVGSLGVMPPLLHSFVKLVFSDI